MERGEAFSSRERPAWRLEKSIAGQKVGRHRQAGPRRRHYGDVRRYNAVRRRQRRPVRHVHASIPAAIGQIVRHGTATRVRRRRDAEE